MPSSQDPRAVPSAPRETAWPTRRIKQLERRKRKIPNTEGTHGRAAFSHRACRASPRNAMTTTRIRRPCNNCPWRLDAPRGHWDTQHFIDIWKNCQDDGLNIMLCHKANALPAEERPSMPCQGWIRVIGFDAIGVRLLVMRNQVTLEEVNDQDGQTLFPTFTAMLRANKIPRPARSRAVPRQARRPR